MREYFEKQLETSETITPEKLKQIHGKPIYGEWEVGDKFCFFFELETCDGVRLSIKTVKERDLDKLKEDYDFEKMHTDTIPVLSVKL